MVQALPSVSSVLAWMIVPEGKDIGLLVELPAPVEDHRRKALHMVARLQQELGDQPCDVLVVDPTTEQQAIHRQARRTGVEL